MFDGIYPGEYQYSRHHSASRDSLAAVLDHPFSLEEDEKAGRASQAADPGTGGAQRVEEKIISALSNL